MIYNSYERKKTIDTNQMLPIKLKKIKN